jgi:hypothetical protein
MESNPMLRQRFMWIRSLPIGQISGVVLVFLALTGCLTTYAADLSEPPSGDWSNTRATAIPTATLPHTASATPGVTLVPNMAVRALQTVPPTATATLTSTAQFDTPTPTATLTPSATGTPTQEPTATPEPTNTPAPTATPRPTTIPATAIPFQAYAWLDNYYPAPGSVVTVYGILLKNGRPVNGAQMGVTWGYTHGQGYCTAYTGIDGRAACAQNIGAPLPDYWVYIDVVFIHEDELYYAKTAFLTDP